MSSTMVSCSVPVRGSGAVSVSVSNNGVDSSNGALFVFGGTGSVWEVMPSHGPSRGGTMITVRGVDAADVENGVVCMWGEESVAGVVGGDGTIVCRSPSSVGAGVVGVRLSEGSDRRDLGQSVMFEYYDGPFVYDVRPTIGGLSGGTVVSVLGAGFAGTSTECRFGTDTVRGEQARVLTSSVVACVSPVAGVAGGVAVEVSLNGGSDFTNDRVQYVYGTSASVQSVMPSRGTSGVSGQVVTVVGSDFQHGTGLSCRFGVSGLSVSGLYESSSLVVCTVPSRTAGSVRVDVSNNGLDWSESQTRFLYEHMDGVWSLSPSRGPVRGGTPIVVTQSGVGGNYSGVYCVFGSTEVAATLAVDGGYACTSPSVAGAGGVSVRVVEGAGRR